MNEDQAAELIKELQTIAKLLTLNALAVKNQTDRVSTLIEFGFDNKEIADLLGMKSNLVSAFKSKIEKKIEKEKKDKPAKEENTKN
jgi:hypothetical protein